MQEYHEKNTYHEDTQYYFRTKEFDVLVDKDYIVDEQFIFSKIDPEHRHNNWMNMRYEYIKSKPDEMQYDFLMNQGLMIKELYACKYSIQLVYHSMIKIYKVLNLKNEIYKTKGVDGKFYYNNTWCASDAEQYTKEIIYKDYICNPQFYYPDFNRLYNMKDEDVMSEMDRFEKSLLNKK